MYKHDHNGHRILSPMNCYQFDVPFHLFDQNFARGLHGEDILQLNNHRPQRLHSGLESGRSQVECTKDLFQVKLDVQHFAPQEIHVKVVEDCVVIKGKHDERLDHHVHASREFTRKYHLPPGVKTESVKRSMTSDGVLVISAKRQALPAPDHKETPIAIMHTGKPAVHVRGVSLGSCCLVKHDKNDQQNADEPSLKK